MAWNAIAEIDAPGKIGRVAISVIVEAGQKTANAADDDANG